MQAVLKKKNEQLLGGHNMGPAAPALLGAARRKPASIIKRNVFDIFDQHNTDRLANDRLAERFLEAHSDLSLTA